MPNVLFHTICFHVFLFHQCLFMHVYVHIFLSVVKSYVCLSVCPPFGVGPDWISFVLCFGFKLCIAFLTQAIATLSECLSTQWHPGLDRTVSACV